MAVLARFGTFGVENYGDLLIAAILERRLGDLGHGFVHVSPHSGPPVWDDCVPTVAAQAIIADPPDLAGVVVGGGHILHASPTSLDRYDQGGLSPAVAYPSLWLGAAYLAAQQNVPYCWNATGVPQPFSPAGARLVGWATSVADYLAERDRASHARLVDAGVSRLIRVVPDTALETSRLWSAEQLEATFVELFVTRGREVPERVVVIHLNRRYAGGDPELLAARLDRIAERLDAIPILIAMGPCYGDDQLRRTVADLMRSAPVVIDRPQSLRQVAACIARAEAYLGSSLHGLITACSFGTRGMVVVPRSAGTIGKFTGFLEPFQLTEWLAESWDEAELRFGDLIASPSEPWVRVLDAATPILDEHWNRMRSVLDPSSRPQHHGAGSGAKRGAVDRLMTINGPESANSVLYASIIAEQAVRASQLLDATNEARPTIDKSRGEQDRLQTENAELRAAVEQAEAALDDLGRNRDLLQEQLANERAEAARLQQERATEDERQLATFQAATDALIAHDEELMETLLKTAQGLSRIDAHLGKLRDLTQAKKADRLVALAQHDLLEIRDILASAMRLSEDLESEEGPRAIELDAARRVLPGRSRKDREPPQRKRIGEARLRPEKAILSANRSSLAEKLRSELDVTVDSHVNADIVICVHNALDDVKRCLASVVSNTSARHHVIVVDDGSDEECARFLREFSETWPQITLIRNEPPLGYAKAANQGLRQTSSDVVVMLSSDTIVPYHWLHRLIECAESNPRIGIVGPLSNAARYQSVPERIDPNGGWANEPVPTGWDVDQVAAAVETISNRAFPRVPFVSGFCFVIKRAVIDAIGYFDEEQFPESYGEENDYCLRAATAGFELAIADHAYVYHSKSRSYAHEWRRELGKAGRTVLSQHFGVERIAPMEELIRNEPTLASMRLELSTLLKSVRPIAPPAKVLFVLPVRGGGGGAHSIVQEVAGMRRLGIDAQVAVRAQYLPLYQERYVALGNDKELFYSYNTPEELEDRASRFTVVVATIYSSVPLVRSIIARHPWLVPAYYIQDYEPYFFPEGSPRRDEAARSYTLIDDAVPFTKTQWLCETVRRRHGVEVYKVEPSLDHDVFFPPATPRQDAPVKIAAMVRPRSPRRGPARTIEVLRRLTSEYGEYVDVHVFGCTKPELKSAELVLDFPCTNHGILTREQVAELLRDAHIYLDLSDYQAFGRAGLEAMACGCAVVVPALGGTCEYAVDQVNARVVDTTNVETCFEAAHEFVMDATLREHLRSAGEKTASRFTIESAARSEIDLFSRMLAARRPSFVEVKHDAAQVFSSAVPA